MSKKKLKVIPFHKAVVRLLNKCNSEDALKTLVSLLETSLPHHLTSGEKGALTRALGKAGEQTTSFPGINQVMERGRVTISVRETKKKPAKKDSD